MADVFVSYKAEDRARVRPLVDALHADGLSVWWDAHIGGGDDWRESIARELDEAACVIVAWSKRSIGTEGRFVRDEATRALKRGVYLPVRIDKVDPPLGFGESQALPLAGWKGDAGDSRYLAILAAAQAMLGKTTAQRTPAGHKSGVDRRMLIAGGVAVAAVASVGGWFALRGGGVASDSIAVLPFANLSGDPGQAYFSDGMAEELRNALSRITQLKVVARTSSEMMRDSDAKTAARKLGVANILTGSVRRSAATIRVSAQLVSGDDGIELWSQSFDRPFGDVLQIQSGIAASVAEALSIRLGSRERAKLSIGGTKNPAAQDLLLKAMPHGVENEAGLQRSIGLMDAAIALDPDYAEAFARKAFALNFYSGVFAHNAAEAHARQAEATAAAKRAVAIEPRLDLGYAALGAIAQNQINLRGAVAMFERARSLTEANVRVLASYATVLSQIDRTDEALQMIDQAVRLDPLDPMTNEIRAMILYRARRYSEAIAYSKQALAANPGRPRIIGILTLAAFMNRDYAEVRRQLALLPRDDMRRLTVGAFLAVHDGNRAAAEQFRAGAVQRYGDAAHYQYAQIDAQLGNHDQAFSELTSALAEGDAGLSSIKVDPVLDPLRGDPRFAAIVAKLNFP